MKVFDLRCAQGHGFEGWFASEADFISQQDRALLQCPYCGSAAVTRLPSAPRLNVSNLNAEPPARPATQGEPWRAAMLQTLREVMANTTDVGSRFAEEARRMHYGEAQHRAIRGQATRDEAEALHDEGIEFQVLPLPDALKGTLQ